MKNGILEKQENKNKSLEENIKKKITFEGYYYIDDESLISNELKQEYNYKDGFIFKKNSNIIFKKITSLCDFINYIPKQETNYGSEHQIFYRGHFNINYISEPGVFRDNYYEKEYDMYQELLIRCQNDFKDCHTHFDYLKLMQHYGLPTRLLDITLNPLVAFYFACTGNSNNMGEVIVYKIDKSEIKNERSDALTMISCLPRFKKNDQSKLYILYKLLEYRTSIEICQKNISNVRQILNINKTDQILENIEKSIEVQLKEIKNIKISKNKKEYEFNGYEYKLQKDEDLFLNKNKLLKKLLKNNNDLKKTSDENKINNKLLKIIEDVNNIIATDNIKLRLLNEINIEKPAFTDRINPLDIFGTNIVMAGRNNSRIYNQQGAFVAFGLPSYKFDETYKDYTNPIDTYRYKEHGIKTIFYIDKSKKENILSELANVGINKSFIYPEIDDVADDIKNQYK